MKANAFFLKFVRFKVNNGVLVKFWHGNWLYEHPIKSQYILFSLLYPDLSILQWQNWVN